MNTTPRPYRQRARADAADSNTERVLAAALELFVERPLDQVTLAAVAERAGVGLQTVIRRVATKDGLIAAVGAWVGPQVAEDLGPPPGPDPAAVAAAFRRHYSRWAPALARTLQQEDSSPALARNAEGGRIAHRAWLAAAFPDASPLLRARLAGVTGVELWIVLTVHEGLSAEQAEHTVALLITSILENPT
ncbi:helix-turn-helix domain-containing protein [Dactylosporangium sp. CS-047395]|uniref:TetR/AcrR family transcriptional regulator n=1 Tax=Dactylosporangium sp. CS-047395 TaxID=3239936 RepID=UPI003D8B10F2